MTDEIIENDESGNGIKIGVDIPFCQDELADFLNLVVSVIRMEVPRIDLSKHALDRLEDDQLSGEEHPDFRGWHSIRDIDECVCTVKQLNGVRLTVNKRTLTEEVKQFNSPLALEIVGMKESGDEGTIALAFIERQRIRIITLL